MIQIMNMEFQRRTLMARNAVQFQKGLSEAEFTRRYGTEPQCRAIVIAARWPDGFICPACGGGQHTDAADALSAAETG
jgi:hypothetical protein